MCVKCRMNRELSYGRKGNLRYIVRIPLLQYDNQIIIFGNLSYCSQKVCKGGFFMSKSKALFLSSYNELKKVRCITLLGMLGAISIVINYFLTYLPTEALKISFNFLPNEFAYYLFGPVVGGVYGAALDILSFIVRPTGPYFYGFTLSSILTGILFGFILYKKPLSLRRIIIAKIIHMITISLLLNTYWLTILYGYHFTTILLGRSIKALIALPIEITLLHLLIKGANTTGIIKSFKDGRN